MRKPTCLTGAVALLLHLATTELLAQQPEVWSGYTEKIAVHGNRFMISAANPHAVRAGYTILKQGGSAVDAAITTQMMLGLVEGQSSGIGGDASLLHWNAAQKKLTAIDGRVVAPAAADEDLFYDRYGEKMSRKETGFGGLAVGTPTSYSLALSSSSCAHAATSSSPSSNPTATTSS